MRNEERGRPQKKFGDNELQVLFYEDDTQNQKQMAEMLNVSQKTISNRLKIWKTFESVENGCHMN